MPDAPDRVPGAEVAPDPNAAHNVLMRMWVALAEGSTHSYVHVLACAGPDGGKARAVPLFTDSEGVEPSKMLTFGMALRDQLPEDHKPSWLAFCTSSYATVAQGDPPMIEHDPRPMEQRYREGDERVAAVLTVVIHAGGRLAIQVYQRPTMEPVFSHPVPAPMSPPWALLGHIHAALRGTRTWLDVPGGMRR